MSLDRRLNDFYWKKQLHSTHILLWSSGQEFFNKRKNGDIILWNKTVFGLIVKTYEKRRDTSTFEYDCAISEQKFKSRTMG